MADKLTVQQTNTINSYLKKHPNVKREDAIKLLFGNTAQKETNKGVKVEHGKQGKTQTITLKSGLSVDVAKGCSVQTKEGIVSLMQSGRYTVKGKDDKIRYYAANGTELNEKYFKQVESGNVIVKNSKGVVVDVNKRLQNRIARASKELKETEDNQGWMGKLWSGAKNTFGFGDSSDKVKEQLKQERKLLKQFNQNPQNRAKIFKQLTGLDYNSKNLQDFIDGKIQLKSEQKLDGYKEGQKIAVDVSSDVGSGILAFGAFVLAVPTGGASIGVGLALATVAGAGSKMAIKASDTIGTDRKYNVFSKEAASDAIMGGVNGFIAPLTAGAGGAMAKTIAVRTGVQVVKEAGKQGTKQVISQATKTAAKKGFARTFQANLKESIVQPNNYKLVGGTLSKRLVAYGAEGAVDGGLSGGVYSGVETAKNGGSVGEVLQATAIGFGMGALMGGAMTSLAHGKGVITGNKGAGEVLEDAIDTSLAPLWRGSRRGAVDAVPTPKPQGAKSTATMSNKKLQKNISDKMDKKTYKYFYSNDKEFFEDNINLRLTNNFLTENTENGAFLELRTLLKSVSKNNSQLKSIIADLSDEGLKPKDILRYLREFNNVDKKFAELSTDATNSILRMQKSGVDSDSLLSFIKLKMENPNIKSFDLLKNYGNRYAQFSDRLNTVSSHDIINEFRLLIKDAEFEGHNITKQDLKEIISNIKIEHGGLNKDEMILAKFDKEMFDDLSKMIDNTPLNEFENISDYIVRIDKIRREQTKINESAKFNANKETVEKNYTSAVAESDEIILTPEELTEFNSRKDYYINKSGDPSLKQGMGVSYEYGKEQKFLDFGLQHYERYNSTKYFAQNSGMKPYGKTGDYKYIPVIRFLDLEKSRYSSVNDLVESFPAIGGSYQAKALKCCFTTPVGSNENHIISDVIVEIHPVSETSNARLVGGWGREVRYGGNQKFKVIDKYCKVEEADFGSGIKREVKGHVVLQEVPQGASVPKFEPKPTPKPQGAKPNISREKLKASLQNGKKVTTSSNVDSHINIPTGKNAAPGAKFLETDEAFKQILTDKKYDVLYMHQKYKITGDLDEFIKDMYSHYVKETDIGQFAPELSIKSNTGGNAGAFNHESNSLMLSKDYINKESDVAHNVAHELNHWFQNKEMILTTPQGPELTAYNRVLGNLKEMVKNGDITSQADFDRYLKEWANEDAVNLRITFEDLLNSTKYPHNNDPSSPYFQKANQYFEAESNYEHQGDNYWGNFTEVESERRGFDAEKAYDQIINEDLALENQAINEIMLKINEKFGTVDNNTKLQILELAIQDLKNPEFANYTIDRFVDEFIKKLI